MSKNELSYEQKIALLKKLDKFLDEVDKLQGAGFGRSLDVTLKTVDVGKSYKIDAQKTASILRQNELGKTVEQGKNPNTFDLDK